ncbi:MAG: ROK family protein [Patescibacteria group bacterium]
MYLLFDIGGTNMRLAVSEDGHLISKTEIVPTPHAYEEGIKLFVQTARHLIGSSSGSAGGRKLVSIVGGIAGPVDHKNNLLLGGTNMQDWIGKPFGADVSAALSTPGGPGVPVTLQNDASMAALGEAMVGVGKGFDIVAYITIGTGVGGARIVKGQIDTASIGFEPGHQMVDLHHTLEDYISGAAVEKATGKKPKEIPDPIFWDEIAKILAFGLANTAVHWSPDVIVLGGSMITGDPAIPIDTVEKHLQDFLKIYPELPIIKKAKLGDIGGLLGALEYAQHAARSEK